MSNYPGITSIFGTRLSTSSAFACSVRLHVIASAGSPLPSLQPPLSSLMGSSRQSLAFVVVAFPKMAGYTHTNYLDDAPYETDCAAGTSEACQVIVVGSTLTLQPPLVTKVRRSRN